jgi:hypothetical protein
MRLFKQDKTKAQVSRDAALKATKGHMQEYIDRVSRNGHFSYTWTIRKGIQDGRDLSADIVDTMKFEFEKEGYTVVIENDCLIIKW